MSQQHKTEQERLLIIEYDTKLSNMIRYNMKGSIQTQNDEAAAQSEEILMRSVLNIEPFL